MYSRLYVLLIPVLLTGCSSAKKAAKTSVTKKYIEVIGKLDDGSARPDQYAMYPDGQKGINELIIKNIKYPAEARKMRITGKVVLKYMVEKDGYIKQIDVERSVNPHLDDEAIRIIRLMDRWAPGQHDGRPVRVVYHQPFNFTLN